jgi:septum site-determining protein MinC
MYSDEADLMKEAELQIEKEPREKKDKDDGSDMDLISNSYFDAKSVFINNTVRSGQRIECEGDIVVIGDVNPEGRSSRGAA